ncbi:tyrosine-type recombinase/integrase [Sphingomonas abietis]|uniref:Tyrosine-type recombinase/integrase n=1 Tax=Sphingomonas abietis TaxID=3012344 RepID=A0ABY7NMC5_9SPHN|nr:tyrosine-type recombinase/integrase [Sphingomonas abietis]WBO22503.1 tyrosine-type recombinase/integrase [Sphingomonas abietis]
MLNETQHALAPVLSGFLNEHIIRDRGLSQLTRSSYAHTFILLIRFIHQKTGKPIDRLQLEDISSEIVMRFLDDLEQARNNSRRTRNLRLAAIRSFFRYVQMRIPAALELAASVRALAAKKAANPVIDWLSIDEARAIIQLPSMKRRDGIRDRAMLSVAYICALRVSEVLALSLSDLDLGSKPTLHVIGKGRRARILPLAPDTVQLLRAWLSARPDVPYDHIFLNRHGFPLSRDGFAARLARYVELAAGTVPSLAQKRVTPHVLRHSCAMHMLKATRDIRKVALWLGHASIQSTEIYLHADPEEKLEILTSHGGLGIKPGKFASRASSVMSMLEAARKPSDGLQAVVKLR